MRRISPCILLDQKTITEEPARGGEYKTYSDDKTLHAPFPAIAPGVVVEEEYVRARDRAFFRLRAMWAG